MRLKPQEGDNRSVPSVQICTLSLLITTNKLVKSVTLNTSKRWLTGCLAIQDTAVLFGILPGEPLFYDMPCLILIDLASLRQTPAGPDPGITATRSRVARLMTSYGLLAIGWWSVTSRLIDRWVKSMLCLARREITADEITTVPEGGN